MNMRTKASILALALTALSTPLLADSDTAKIEALQRQIQALQARIEILEARETFTSFMPNFAERFQVMHRAGEAGDWAVASHELEEMKRLARNSVSIDAEKGRLMQNMMDPVFEALEHDIEHGNQEEFEDELVKATNTCNACHQATGSNFIQVTLDVPDSLSLRHPHKFTQEATAGGHTH